MQELLDVDQSLSFGVGIEAVARYTFRRLPIEKALGVSLCCIPDVARLGCSPIEVVDVSKSLREVEMN